VAEELSEITRLDALRSLMARAGVTRIVFKRLAPNDNSKNQIYLGGDYTALQILPYSDVTADISRTDSKRDRFKTKVKLQWLNKEGALFEAPATQLILYPKYPEVRLSGFLKGAGQRPSQHLASRNEGRVLILGITPDDRIVAHVIGAENPLNKQLDQYKLQEGHGLFVDIPLVEHLQDTRGQLLDALKEIAQRGWVNSVKLDKTGNAIPYRALNGGGYTLEAMLGVVPNGKNEPDYLGWEIKQHKSPALEEPLKGGALTLMTPEPTGGYYRTNGAKDFIRTFGYPDKKGRPDRLNFGGVHRYEQTQTSTGLMLHLDGFNADTGKIEDLNGGIVLRSADGTKAAIWYYKTLIEQWTRKHAKAAYIPSLSRKEPQMQYRYGHVVGLGEKSSITHFLQAVAATEIYYDPGIKLEHASTDHSKIKKRSQFRIKPKDIPTLYELFEVINLRET